ncbi:hypothetical protein FRC09_010901 [Ceratobasidium sp. 395]|nr:hypothetical protein FRC09_010901 [Ceratobasidium sp. 395]
MRKYWPFVSFIVYYKRRSTVQDITLEVTKRVGTSSKKGGNKRPPVTILLKKKCRSLARRIPQRTFKRIPQGAQVEVLGAHAAVWTMSAMNEEIDAEDKASTASVIVAGGDENGSDHVRVAGLWFKLENEPAALSSPSLVESSQDNVKAGVGEMEWSMIDEDECRAAA